jgi:hypothetical protein
LPVLQGLVDQGRRPAQIRATLTTEGLEELKRSGKAIKKRDAGGLEGIIDVF